MLNRRLIYKTKNHKMTKVFHPRKKVERYELLWKRILAARQV